MVRQEGIHLVSDNAPAKAAVPAAPVSKKLTPAQQATSFIIGGIAGIVATTCIQPFDFVKVRIQLLSAANPGTNYSMVSIAKETVAKDGPLGLYKGLSAAWMRQIIYGSTRFGLYLNLFDYIKDRKGGENLNVFEKIGVSLTAGGIGAFVGSPCELVLLRMQGDAMLPEAEKRNYKGFFDAISRIRAADGTTGLWRGATPGISRSMAAAMGLFTSYETCKEVCAKQLPNSPILAWTIASFMAGGCCAAVSMPFDNAKTKLQQQKPGPDGKLPYKNILHAMSVCFKDQGLFGLWTGFPSYVLRIAPHVIVSLCVLEKLKKLVGNA